MFLAALVWFVSGAPISAAVTSPVGNWAKPAEGGTPAATMTIESWGIGNTRLSYGANEGVVATVASRLDGTDAPVIANLQPTPATIAITLDDELHATVISKMNLQPVGTSKWTFSPDFQTLTIENTFTRAVPGTPAGNSVERWTRASPEGAP